MPIENPQLVRFLLGFLSVLVLVQAVGVVIVVFLVDRQINKLVAKSDALLRSLDTAATEALSCIQQLAEFTQRLPEWEKRITAASDALTAQAVGYDETAARTLQGMFERVRKGREQTDRALRKYVEVSHMVHRAVIQPARTISSAVSSLQAVIGSFLSRDSDKVKEQADAPSFPDQQIFI